MGLYTTVRGDTDTRTFYRYVKFTREELDELVEFFRAAIEEVMGPRLQMDEIEIAVKKARARKLRTEEQLFLYMTAHGGSNRGGIGHFSLGVNFGLSEGTVTNYIHQVSIKVHRVLKDFNPIVWPTAEELAAMQGLLIGYVEKGTPRGDALFTPWSGGRDFRAAYR
jgi:hypothetical protein